MFDKSDIIARLQDGDTMEEIAGEMSQMLNEAEAIYKDLETKRLEEEKAAAAAKAEADRVYESKMVAAGRILEGIGDYFIAAGEEELFSEMDTLTPEFVMGTLDHSITLAKSLEKLKTLEFPVGDSDRKIDGLNMFSAMLGLF
jgi:hypothetical protein